MRPVLLAAFLLTPSIASAHAILMGSQPAAGSAVQPGETEIVLRYNSRIDQARSRLTLQGTNAQMVLKLLPESAPDALAAKAELSPGTYTVHWQVLAVDGHMTRGDVRFTVQNR